MRDDPPYDLDDPQRPPDENVRRRVALPALFLLIVSGLNLLAGFYFISNAILIKSGGDLVQAQLDKQWNDLDPAWRNQLEKDGWTEQSLDTAVANFQLGYGGVASLAGVFAVFGSIRMRSLRSHGLAMFGAALTAIPCVTPCCLIGQVAAVWALIVLINPDVRAAFR